MARIGIMGGTFDPIHMGHLVAAEAVRHALELERVLFVPAGQPPHKPGSAISSAMDRYLMAVLATADNPSFIVSSLEIDRRGPSYTIDTLRAVRSQYASDALYFITGIDAILEIFSWREPEELLREAVFIAATRPGYPIARLGAVLDRLPEALRDRVMPLEVPALAIASRDLRQRVREDRTIRYLVPRAVEAYIHKAGLYREETAKGD